MTKLLGIRTVYDIDPSKTFRIADILENGAILPHSVLLSDLMVSELEPDEECVCFEVMGDNSDCPIHGDMFDDHGPFSTDEMKADYQERNDLYNMGMGG